MSQSGNSSFLSDNNHQSSPTSNSSNSTSLVSPVMFLIASLVKHFSNNSDFRTEEEKVTLALLEQIPLGVRNQSVKLVNQSIEQYPTYNPQRNYSKQMLHSRLKELASSEFLLHPILPQSSKFKMNFFDEDERDGASSRPSYSGYLRKSDPVPEFFFQDNLSLPPEIATIKQV